MKTLTLETNTKVTYETIKLSDEIPSFSRTPAVIICPGGGYREHSEREAEVIGKKFLSDGFAYFVVRYKILEEASYPNSLIDLLHTINYVKEHSSNLNIDVDKIVICGFSAGGHVVSSYATQFKNEEILKLANLEHKNLEVSANILVYPVITADWIKKAKYKNLISKLLEKNNSYEEYLDTSKNVTKDTPKTFLVHAQDDNVVPVTDSLSYAAALTKENITYALHIYEEGGHGFSLGNHIFYNSNLAVSSWYDLSLKFLYDKCFKS